MHRTRLFVCLLLVTLAVGAAFAAEKAEEKAADKRAKIDAMAQESLDTVFAKNDKAKGLFDKAHGYAVFDNLKLSLGVSGGGGVGVAVDKSSGARTYMRMGTGGLNLGLGGQKYQLVFLFQDAQTFNRFVDKGWQADAQANAVAGNLGANAGATFTNGVAVFQLTEAGLMLQADIAGTKYWKADKLNR